MRRANETEEQRKQRLKSLQERAKLRRDIVKTTENSEQRKERLAKQADYARTRRIKMNTMEGKQHMEKRARELYARIHKSPEKSLEEIEKNMKSEQISVLKILEPIIEMSTN